jgi:hypothetical protein
MIHHTPTVLKPVPKQYTPARRAVQPSAPAGQVLRATPPSTQLSFQFHRLP